MTLAGKFGIRIRSNIMNVTISMVRDAERNLGKNVPEPFYRTFPSGVRSLTPNRLYYDQLLHYTQTYGLGWWNNPGHSVVEDLTAEETFVKGAFFESEGRPKDFNVIDEKTAMILLQNSILNLLSLNRPLSEADNEIIKEAWKDFGTSILPSEIPCKDTVIKLLYYTKDSCFCKYLKLSDTIKLLSYIQYEQYRSENLKKLNLKNQDRKLITNVINAFIYIEQNLGSDFAVLDFMNCFEKRKIWCGLLHHIHYQSNYPAMVGFIRDIRSNKNFSAYHDFEYHMRRGEYSVAARQLVQFKGKSDLIRHLNYIVSRCSSEKEIKEVLSWLA